MILSKGNTTCLLQTGLLRKLLEQLLESSRERYRVELLLGFLDVRFVRLAANPWVVLVEVAVCVVPYAMGPNLRAVLLDCKNMHSLLDLAK